jgi:hypothetical protein
MNNASSTGAIRFISLVGAKGLSAIDASATFQSGIPAQEVSASERASLRSIEHPPVAKRRRSVSTEVPGFEAVTLCLVSAFGQRRCQIEAIQRG